MQPVDSNNHQEQAPPLVLVAGATGYIGGRLIPLLEREPVIVRCMARDPNKLRAAKKPSTQIKQADVRDPATLDAVMEGVHTAYYLVHLMSSSSNFEKDDYEAAKHFGRTAKKAGVQRIIYLGGLGDDSDPQLSPHLRSRHEVGEILRQCGVETIEFRAGMVVGAGSTSFQLLKSLTDRLPVMICPRWLATPTQPIGIDDVLAYLLAARNLPAGESRIFEIGGADVVTYADLIREYARQRHIRRVLIFVPVLTPYLSGLWLALVTPSTYEVGRHLIEGLKNPTIVQHPIARDVFPIQPVGVADAIRHALAYPDDTNT